MSDSTPETARETLSEGVSEVRQKLRDDLARLRGRRSRFTLSRMIECPECLGNGRTPCSTCQGTGKAKLVMQEQETACTACAGSGSFQCVECGGRRIIPNPGRKKVLLVLWLGGIAWALVLLRLYMMERDLLPGLRASGGGQMLPAPQAQPNPAAPSTGGQPPAARPSYGTPGGGMMQPQGGGMMQPQGGGMMQPQGGGMMQPQGGGGMMQPQGGGGMMQPQGGGGMMQPGYGR